MLPVYDDNPRLARPIVTILLIAACCLAWLWQVMLAPTEGIRVVYQLGMIPASLFGHALLPPDLAVVPPWMTVLTSMFLHAGWLHLLGNMLYLWIFGDNVEASMDRVRFLVFYVACGAAAAFAQALADPQSHIPMVGASGAIAGALGGYLVLHPRARVLMVILIPILWPRFYVPAWIVLAVWFGLQLFGEFGSTGDGVAYWAHIGGFVAGMALVPFFRRRGVPLLAGPAVIPKQETRVGGPSSWRRPPGDWR